MAAEEGADDEGMDDAEDPASVADEPEDADEPHAAAPMLRLTASPDSARIRRWFIVFSLWWIFWLAGMGVR
jgi:hypothetical protein